MRMEINKDDIRIYPEGHADRAFLEHVLGLTVNGSCDAHRCDVVLGLSGKIELNCIQLVKSESPAKISHFTEPSKKGKNT